MNKHIKEVAIRKAVANKYGNHADDIGNLDLEEIILGDPGERNKIREKFLSEKFEKHLDRVIKGR